MFNKALESTVAEIPRKDIRMIVGDWNVKIVTDNTGWERIMQKYGFGEQTEWGEKLLELALKHDM